MIKVTALLLNWKRPENLKRVIQSIRSQSVPIEIFLWNNNSADMTQYDVDLQINSNKNLMCWPRWFMANYASTEYVFSLDDDLMFSDERVIEDCIKYADRYDVNIGYSGVNLNASHQYWESKHIYHPKRSEDVKVDIIKGRFIFCHRSVLRSLEMLPQYDTAQYESRIEDDIILSSYLDKKIIPSFLRDRLGELPSEEGLYDQEIHEQSRQEAVDFYFSKNTNR